MKRGDLWVASGGDDAGKPRPVPIIQNDRFGQTGSIAVCSVSSNPADSPLLRVVPSPGSENVSRKSIDLGIFVFLGIARCGPGKHCGAADPDFHSGQPPMLRPVRGSVAMQYNSPSRSLREQRSRRFAQLSRGAGRGPVHPRIQTQSSARTKPLTQTRPLLMQPLPPTPRSRNRVRPASGGVTHQKPLLRTNLALRLRSIPATLNNPGENLPRRRRQIANASGHTIKVRLRRPHHAYRRRNHCLIAATARSARRRAERRPYCRAQRLVSTSVMSRNRSSSTSRSSTTRTPPPRARSRASTSSKPNRASRSRCSTRTMPSPGFDNTPSNSRRDPSSPEPTSTITSSTWIR